MPRWRRASDVSDIPTVKRFARVLATGVFFPTLFFKIRLHKALPPALLCRAENVEAPTTRWRRFSRQNISSAPTMASLDKARQDAWMPRALAQAIDSRISSQADQSFLWHGCFGVGSVSHGRPHRTFFRLSTYPFTTYDDALIQRMVAAGSHVGECDCGYLLQTAAPEKTVRKCNKLPR